MLEEKNFRSSNKANPFVAAFINWSTECEKIAPMTRLCMGVSEIIFDVTLDMRQRV